VAEITITPGDGGTPRPGGIRAALERLLSADIGVSGKQTAPGMELEAGG